jgi:RNA 2',3'-cyclic 3'-phosphodiesterase
MIRTFIALTIPEEIKAVIGTAISELRAKNHALRWVKPEGLHITLKFLGDIPEETVAPLAADLDKAAALCPPLTLGLSGFGAFPNTRRPRVVWVGLEGDMHELSSLALNIDKTCVAYGITAERRPFSGHITLGRLKAPTMVDLATNLVKGLFNVSQVLLYQSVLLPSGASYNVLHRSSLGSKGG